MTFLNNVMLLTIMLYVYFIGVACSIFEEVFNGIQRTYCIEYLILCKMSILTPKFI